MSASLNSPPDLRQLLRCAGAQPPLAEQQQAPAPAVVCSVSFAGRMRPWVRWATALNLVAVLSIWGVLWIWGDDFWIGTAMLYAPRSPYAIPAVLLAAFSWRGDRRVLGANLLSAGIVLGPVMGLRCNLADAVIAPPATAMTVVSCNVQFYKPNFPAVAKEILSYHPDVVALQDADENETLVKPFFKDWNIYHEGEFLIASRHPLKKIALCVTEVYGRETALICEVSAPAGKFRIASLHHMSPREGLASIRPGDVLKESGERPVEQEVMLRAAEAMEVRAFIEKHREDLPLLVVGDFNFPIESQMYQENYGDLTNAFDAAGLGYGYTILCTTRTLWPTGCPWCRIDHILAGPEWKIHRGWAGTSNGSDHRCMAASVELLFPVTAAIPSAN